ncbi:MAG: hypothetical protein R2795_17610 [Saprospiraceae bacterium]
MTLGINGFGECLPYADNRVFINQDVKDIHGLPTLTIDAEFKANEMAMRKDMGRLPQKCLKRLGLRMCQFLTLVILRLTVSMKWEQLA